MTERKHRRQWRHYETVAGKKPVLEFIRALPDDDAAEIFAAMAEVRDEGVVAARHLRGDIFEVRVDGVNRIFRVLFAAEGRFSHVLLSLSAFTKKTQKTPPSEIDTAEKRLNDWRSRAQRKSLGKR